LGVDLLDRLVDHQHGGLSALRGGDVDLGDGVVSLGERRGACRGACAGAAGVGDGYAGNRTGSTIRTSLGHVADLRAVGEGTDADVGVVDRSGDLGSRLLGGF
ncbi:hypothetical protein H4F41_25205, partial [Escherichia coli]|nr:hypothetical protein [Escherichia coli]